MRFAPCVRIVGRTSARASGEPDVAPLAPGASAMKKPGRSRALSSGACLDQGSITGQVTPPSVAEASLTAEARLAE